MKAIVLAGGFGKRLKPLTDTIPKPMLPIKGKPILLWQMEWLRSQGINEFVLCVGYLKEAVRDYFGDGSRFGVRVDYVYEDEPLGTGGALNRAREHFPAKDLFFAFNGDIVSDINLSDIHQRCEEANATGALALVQLPSPFGIVTTTSDDQIESFVEKPRLADHWVNAGIYCFDPSIADYLPEIGSVETDVFPILASEGKLVASKHSNCYWKSVDSMKDLEEAAMLLKA